MDLYLIRHGQNPAPSPADLDPDLNEIGLAQISLVRWDEKKARFFVHTVNDYAHLA